jgi:hypothetical protein
VCDDSPGVASRCRQYGTLHVRAHSPGTKALTERVQLALPLHVQHPGVGGVAEYSWWPGVEPLAKPLLLGRVRFGGLKIGTERVQQRPQVLYSAVPGAVLSPNHDDRNVKTATLAYRSKPATKLLATALISRARETRRRGDNQGGAKSVNHSYKKLYHSYNKS